MAVLHTHKNSSELINPDIGINDEAELFDADWVLVSDLDVLCLPQNHREHDASRHQGGKLSVFSLWWTS